MKETDFLGEFMSNPARARLLRIFVIDDQQSFTVKDIARRAGVSGPIAEREIKALEKIGIVKKRKSLMITLKNGTAQKVEAKTKIDTWTINDGLKEFTALSKFVQLVSPMRYERIVEALRRSGKITAVILSGNFLGDPSRPADMLIAGDAMNEGRLEAAIKTFEPEFGREIRYACFTTPEFRYRLTVQDRLVRDTLDFPHLVLLDRARLL